MVKINSIFLIINYFYINVNCKTFEKQINEKCTSTLTSFEGVCVKPGNCDQFVRRRNELDICAFDGKLPIVCCPTSDIRASNIEERKSVSKCKEYSKLSFSGFLSGFVSPLQIQALNARKKRKIRDTSQIFNPTGVEIQIQVVGGHRVSINEFPHMSVIGTRDGLATLWKCGGSLISDDFVLTAAHCVTETNNRETLVVRIGDKNLQSDNDGVTPQEFSVKTVFRHPEYRGKTSKTKYNDIALIQLSTKAVFNKDVKPACLSQHSELNLNESVDALGWGTTSYSGQTSEELLKAELRLKTNEKCNEHYIEDSDELPQGIISSQICAGDDKRQKDTCQGDSGGPLQLLHFNENQLKYYEIIGITSFGKFCAAGTPGVYTRVSSFLEWIESIVWS